jgi:hypothetical protein
MPRQKPSSRELHKLYTSKRFEDVVVASGFRVRPVIDIDLGTFILRRRSLAQLSAQELSPASRPVATMNQ